MVLVDITPLYLNPIGLGPSMHGIKAQVLRELHTLLASLSTLERKAVLWQLQQAYDEYGDRR